MAVDGYNFSPNSTVVFRREIALGCSASNPLRPALRWTRSCLAPTELPSRQLSNLPCAEASHSEHWRYLSRYASWSDTAYSHFLTISYKYIRCCWREI
jgi:hypothetical protein